LIYIFLQNTKNDLDEREAGFVSSSPILKGQ
jgi:hypothetical protein